MYDNFRTDMGWDSLIVDDGMEIHLYVTFDNNDLISDAKCA